MGAIRTAAVLTAGLVAVNAAVAGAVFLASPETAGFQTREYQADTLSSANTDNPEEESAPSSGIPAASLPAARVAKQLLKEYPAGSARKVEASTGMFAAGLPYQLHCPSVAGESAISPAVVESVSLAPRGDSAGGWSVQTHVYPAGLAAKAFTEIERQVDECNSSVWSYRTSVGEYPALVIEDSSDPFGGGPGGSTVLYRAGDIVGVVAGRNVGSVTGSASQWANKWAPLVEDSSCRTLWVDEADALRNPLDPQYEGWLRTEQVSLDSSEKSASLAGALLQVRVRSQGKDQGLVAAASGELPDSMGEFPTPEDWLPEYPSYLSVSLPERPTIPEPPSFPASPNGSEPVTGKVPDPRGPGCGWGFTGLSAPPFNDAAEAARVRAETDAVKQRLSKAKVGFDWQRWEFALSKAAYERRVNRVNQWAKDARVEIATVWWTDYDKKFAKWKRQHARWEAEYAQWEFDAAACEAANSIPTPTPTPDPWQPVEPEPPAPDPVPTPTPAPDETVPAEPFTVTPAAWVPGEPCPTPPIEPWRPEKPSIERPR